MISFKHSDGGRVEAGFANEKNDCTVRAAVVRFTTSYARAHELLESVGRLNRRGASLAMLKRLFERMGLEISRPLFRPTLAQFVKDHPQGRFYVVVRGHAIGIVDGVCVDCVTPRPRSRVLLYA